VTRHATAAWFRELEPRRIALIKPSALGDVVQTLPLVSVLRSRFPEAAISWVIQRELRELVEGHPGIAEVIAVPRRPIWSEIPGLLGAMRRRKFDLVFDLQGLLRSAIMTFATGARHRVGLETAREGASLACHAVIPDSGRNLPAYARYWRIAEVLGLESHPRRLEIMVPEPDRQWAGETLSALPRPWFALQWGAQWVTKRWPLDNFEELFDRALATWGGSLLVIGGRGEQAACGAFATRLRHRLPRHSIVNLAGQTSLKQLTAVLTEIDCLVSNDSGPLHLAAELGRPTMGLFTCTSAVRSGPPPSARHVSVSTQVPCAASYCKTCPRTGPAELACFRELTVERAWQGLERLIRTVDHAPVQATVRAA
jgi:ADP-heptose:LPS heptosyltransferase